MSEDKRILVVDTAEAKTVQNSADDPMTAKGPVYTTRLIEPATMGGFGVLIATFAPGARLSFHTHDVEQILYVLEGKGVIGTRDEQYVVKKGMIVFVPAGLDHYHGATDDALFSHLAFYKGQPTVTE